MADGFEKERWLERLRASVRDGTFVKLTLSSHRGGVTSLKQVLVRRVNLRAGDRLSIVYRHATHDVTKHFTEAEGLELLSDLVGGDFRSAHLFTTKLTAQLEFPEGKSTRLNEGKPAHTTPPSTSHDRARHRSITPEGSRWLHALGVATADGKVAKGMEAKFRQINRFVELLSHSLKDAGAGRSAEPRGSRSSEAPSPVTTRRSPLTSTAAKSLTLVDMGCGKGYLTFAAYDWLRQSGWPEATVRGVEARTDLVELCNRVSQECGFDQLRFEAGAIAGTSLDRADVLVALHACDTATDDAIAKGIQAGTSLILVAPCCHRELRSQLRPPKVMAGALKHGILLERQAEFVTDALRAALLEWVGYDTKVFEFISTEHTSKNLMIAATKRAPAGNRDELERRVNELAAFYGIKTQRLAGQLGFELNQPRMDTPEYT